MVPVPESLMAASVVQPTIRVRSDPDAIVTVSEPPDEVPPK